LFSPSGAELELTRVTDGATLSLSADAIALCTAGTFALSGRLGEATLARGDALFVSSDEAQLVVVGSGELFLATGATGQVRNS
jgi:mannose-6-phosphate isomerase